MRQKLTFLETLSRIRNIPHAKSTSPKYWVELDIHDIFHLFLIIKT